MAKLQTVKTLLKRVDSRTPNVSSANKNMWHFFDWIHPRSLHTHRRKKKWTKSNADQFILQSFKCRILSAQFPPIVEHSFESIVSLRFFNLSPGNNSLISVRLRTKQKKKKEKGKREKFHFERKEKRAVESFVTWIDWWIDRSARYFG